MEDANERDGGLTIRVSRRALRRGGLVAALIAATAVGFGLGIVVADRDDSGARTVASRHPRPSRATTTTSTASSTTTPEVPATPATDGSDGPAGGDGGGVPGAGAAGDGGGAPVAPAATADVSKSIPPCVPPALATKVTVTWQGTGGVSYFLQITSSVGGPPLFRGAVDANGSKTLQPIGCETAVQALFTTNTATGSISDNA